MHFIYQILIINDQLQKYTPDHKPVEIIIDDYSLKNDARSRNRNLITARFRAYCKGIVWNTKSVTIAGGFRMELE